MAVDVAALRRQWNECLRLLDGDRVRALVTQPSEYYYAQSHMLNLLWEAAPALLDAYERPPRENTSLLAYGTHKPGCGGLISTTGRACECGWIQVRDLAKEATDA